MHGTKAIPVFYFVNPGVYTVVLDRKDVTTLRAELLLRRANLVKSLK